MVILLRNFAASDHEGNCPPFDWFGSTAVLGELRSPARIQFFTVWPCEFRASGNLLS